MADKTIVNYDDSQRIAKFFQEEGEAWVELTARTLQMVHDLEDDWIGMGADKFFEEMDSEMLPALKRLTDSLFFSRDTLVGIMNIFRGAEEETANYFKDGQLEGGNGGLGGDFGSGAFRSVLDTLPGGGTPPTGPGDVTGGTGGTGGAGADSGGTQDSGTGGQGGSGGQGQDSQSGQAPETSSTGGGGGASGGSQGLQGDLKEMGIGSSSQQSSGGGSTGGGGGSQGAMPDHVYQSSSSGGGGASSSPSTSSSPSQSSSGGEGGNQGGLGKAAGTAGALGGAGAAAGAAKKALKGDDDDEG